MGPWDSGSRETFIRALQVFMPSTGMKSHATLTPTDGALQSGVRSPTEMVGMMGPSIGAFSSFVNQELVLKQLTKLKQDFRARSLTLK